MDGAKVGRPVSILVSYWMGWESVDAATLAAALNRFNPSFLLDGLGIVMNK